MKVIVKVSCLQCFPFISVKPYTFTPSAMIKRKPGPVPRQEFDHAPTALRAVELIECFISFKIVSAGILFGQVWAMFRKPVPILRAPDEVPFTRAAFK